MSICLRKLSCSFLLLALTLAGCGDGKPEPIVPNKPPLSAAEAQERNKALQLEMVEKLEQQMKQSKQ